VVDGGGGRWQWW